MFKALLLREFGSREYRFDSIRTWYWSQLCAAWGKSSRVYGPITVFFPQRIKIGEHVAINVGAILHGRGGITVGDWVHISSRAILNSSSMDFHSPREHRTGITKPIVIGSGAWICSGAIINPGVSIGEDAMVGPGAVVTRDVPARTVVAAAPVRMGEIRAPQEVQ